MLKLNPGQNLFCGLNDIASNVTRKKLDLLERCFHGTCRDAALVLAASTEKKEQTCVSYFLALV